MASIIASVALSRKTLVSPAKVSTPVTETPVELVEVVDNFNMAYLLGRACRTALQQAQEASDSLQFMPVNEEHASVLVETSRTILQVPFKLPQYFFVSLQQTNIKLNLSPPVPPAGQCITINLNTHLTLKVEGVIEHSGRTSLYRSPKAVHVQVSPTLERLISRDAKPPELKTLHKTEPVENDYFQAQFLLSLPAQGYYGVHIDASLLDSEGTIWHTGPRVTMSVHVDTRERLQSQVQMDSGTFVSQQQPGKVLP